MADKEKYIIKIQGELVEVSEDVFYAYFRMERQERGQEEKKWRNGVLSYDALDNQETVGVASFPDLSYPSMEEAEIARESKAQLHRVIELLPRADRELIKAIYFDAKTEQEYAKEIGMSQSGVSYRLKKALSKIRSILEVLGY